MKNISFKYIPYNLEENSLHKKIKNINNEKTLIIVQNEVDKNFFTTTVNENRLKKTNNILSLDDFLEKIFFTDKYVLKDIKRFMAFYLSLSKEIKEKFNIKSYHDSIELADEFFEYYSYFSDLDKDSFSDINLAAWQKEKIENFSLIKKEMDIFLEKNSYIPSDWLNKIENLDLFFLRNFKKIIFFDVVDFPENFKEVLEKLKDISKIEVILQIEKGDFNERELKLEKISYSKISKNIQILKYKNDFEIYPEIMKEILQDSNFFSGTNQIDDNYSLFNKNSTYLFNDSKLYKIIESYINLFEAIYIKGKDKDKNFINLFKLKENIFTPSFMEFYGLDVEDIKTFDKILADNYIYLSLEKVKTNYFDYYFKDGNEKNENLHKKLIIILENLFAIEEIKNIHDLNEFFKERFFKDEDEKFEKNINFFMENKFSNIYDMFYEILGLLNTSENMEFFKNFNKIFSSNLGQNIFILFFNHLNNITLYSSNKNIENNKQTTLKNIYSIKNLFLDEDEENIILNMSANSLLKIKSKFSLLTETQKKTLNLKTREDLILNEKYRLYQNLNSLKKVKFFLLYDLENNIDFSSFIYEFIEAYSYKEIFPTKTETLMRSFYENYKQRMTASYGLSPLPMESGALEQTPETKSDYYLTEESVSSKAINRERTLDSLSFLNENGINISALMEDTPRNSKKNISFKKEASDFIRKDKDGNECYQLRIGAYDYEKLKDKETFFFLKNICGLDSVREKEEIDGFSLATFGTLLHKSLENLLKDNWENILNSKEELLFKTEKVEEYLRRTLKNSELKFEVFTSSYFKEIILPKLVKNIYLFFSLIYKEVKDSKILRIEAEKKNWNEHSFMKARLQNIDIEVLLTGRADFVMETDKAKYIIDFKTGGTQKDQLDFYAVMLFEDESKHLDSKKNISSEELTEAIVSKDISDTNKLVKKSKKEIFTANYNFWETFSENEIKFKSINLEETSQKIKETILTFFENDYYIPPQIKDFSTGEYDFSKFYNYIRICQNLVGDNDE